MLGKDRHVDNWLVVSQLIVSVLAECRWGACLSLRVPLDACPRASRDSSWLADVMLIKEPGLEPLFVLETLGAVGSLKGCFGVSDWSPGGGNDAKGITGSLGSGLYIEGS